MKLHALLTGLLVLMQLHGMMALTGPAAEGHEDTAPKKRWIHAERAPEYPGGIKALSAFLQKNIKYPKEAKKARLQGRVFVSFVIDTLGQVTQVRVLKSLGYGCNEEAIRVVELMPCWLPGEMDGRKVEIKYNLPISFPQEPASR